MNIENSEFILLALHNLKERDKKDKISYRELEQYINQERPQISQALIKNEKEGYIKKEKDHKRFNDIIITEQGTRNAKQLTQKFGKFFNKSYISKTQKYSKTNHKKPALPNKLPLEDSKKTYQNQIKKITLALKSKINEIIKDHIPDHYHPKELIDDLFYGIQDLLYDKLMPQDFEE